MYVVDSRHCQNMVRASQNVVKALGPSFPLKSLLPLTAETVWRHLRKDALATGPEPSGWRKAEKAVQVLSQTARWIHERSPNSVPLIGLPLNWKTKLREECEAAFACPIRDPKTLRHTREEASRLFSRLGDADPRLALEIELGAELRRGQVIRSKRRQLNLGEVGAYGCGLLEVPGYGKKKGEIVHLDPERRAFLDRCLAPGGLASLIVLFKRFEEACGIEHVPHRSFYGLRPISPQTTRTTTARWTA